MNKQDRKELLGTAGGIVRGTGKRLRWARQAGQKDRLSKRQEGQAKQQSEKEHAVRGQDLKARKQDM